MQTFKVGPDFLDPTYLSMASGRTCYNLASWMMGKEYLPKLLAQTTKDADIAIIEGVMGLYDGASPDRLDGSTAEVADILDAPIVLIANARGLSRSFAAMVKGFTSLEEHINISAVIANRCGSDRQTPSAQLPEHQRRRDRGHSRHRRARSPEGFCSILCPKRVFGFPRAAAPR